MYHCICHKAVHTDIHLIMLQGQVSTGQTQMQSRVQLTCNIFKITTRAQGQTRVLKLDSTQVKFQKSTWMDAKTSCNMKWINNESNITTRSHYAVYNNKYGEALTQSTTDQNTMQQHSQQGNNENEHHNEPTGQRWNSSMYAASSQNTVKTRVTVQAKTTACNMEY